MRSAYLAALSLTVTIALACVAGYEHGRAAKLNEMVGERDEALRQIDGILANAVNQARTYQQLYVLAVRGPR